MLHPRLAEDCLRIGAFPLCELLLMNDARYPWYILVPRRDDIREIYELTWADQQQLMYESSQLACSMDRALSPDKLNIATIGNVVPQLHMHHIARFDSDDTWPAPVWGQGTSRPYAPDNWQKACAPVLELMASTFNPVPTTSF